MAIDLLLRRVHYNSSCLNSKFLYIYFFYVFCLAIHMLVLEAFVVVNKGRFSLFFFYCFSH